VYYHRLFPHSYDCNLIQLHLDFHSVVLLFLQTQSHGRGIIFTVLSPKYLRSNLQVAIRLLCTVWLWGDLNYTSALCILTSIVIKWFIS
jgi:hypothetical protein